MSYKKLSGPQILSNLLPNDAKKLLKNRGFFELELLSNWEKIVGTSFNKLSYPTKIKTSNSSPKGKGKLVVKVDRSISFAFEHEHKKIVDKINLFYKRFENSKENGFVDKAINLIDCDDVYADVFKYVFGDTVVFSDLDSAKLSKQKIRMVTLSGELLEVSGAITGGSKVNKDLAYRFGTNNDIDEAHPIKQRLSIIEEALKKSDNDILNKTNNLLTNPLPLKPFISIDSY